VTPLADPEVSIVDRYHGQAIPNRWRPDREDGRSMGTLSKTVRAVLAAHGGVCSTEELFKSIQADSSAAQLLKQGKGLEAVLASMKRGGFVTIECGFVKRTNRRYGHGRS
jgi:hypothetical protein